MRARFESLELRQPEGRALSLPLINALVCWINASCPRHLALTRKAPKLANQGSPRRMDGEATTQASADSPRSKRPIRASALN